MNRKRKIAVITSSRADYNLLYWPIKTIIESEKLELKLIVTGSHLCEKKGLTINEIKKDKLPISVEIPILNEESSDVSLVEVFGKASSLIAGELRKTMPDIVLVLGDRYEILAAVIAASFLNIPIAHLCGGDVTEGALDDAIRHSISKFSHIHFPSTHEAARRLIQLGECEKNIFMVGSTGLDYIKKCSVISKQSLLSELSILSPELPIYLITFHPVTLEKDRGLKQLQELLKALDRLLSKSSCNLIFTGVNPDPGASFIEKEIMNFCENRSNCYYFLSLGPQKYINMIRICEAMIGNSSSGFYEAPFLGKPTINIGNRQKGRVNTNSIFNIEADQDIIFNTIHSMQDRVLKDIISPYGDGESSERIISILENIELTQNIQIKKFQDLPIA
jgi:UDP-hydrolysing UDP-N-acetyl-D-glucosamine 2-epimerase